MAEFDPLENELATERVEQRTSSVVLSYLGILRRRIWVVIPVVIIAGTVGLIKAYRTLPIYRASAQLLVQRQASIFLEHGEARDTVALSDEFFSTQRELLTSKAVMDIALREPELKFQFEGGLQDGDGDASFIAEIRDTIAAALNISPPPEKMPWQKLQSTVGVSYNDESHFLYVDATSSSPARAAKRANKVAAAFSVYHDENRARQMTAGGAVLKREKEREELALLEAEKALAEFRRNSDVVFSEEEGSAEPLQERMALINEKLGETEIQRIELQSQISIMRDALDSKVPSTIDRQLRSIPIISDNEQLARARQDLADTEKEFYRLQEFYGSSHPLMLEASTNVYHLRQIFRETLNEITEAQEKRLAALVNSERELQRKYEDVKGSVVESENERFLYTRLLGEVNRHKQLLNMIIDKIRTTNSSAGVDRITVDIVEDASIPRTPINAGKTETVAFSIVLGLFLGVGLAFLFENLDDSIKTPEDLTERLDIPLLGFVPTVAAEPTKGDQAPDESASDDAPANKTKPKKQKLDAMGNPVASTYAEFFKTIKRRFGTGDETLAGVDLDKKEDLESRKRAGAVVVHQPMSSIAEAYRSIRANLFYSTPAEELKLLAITSSRPQEGKTTTSTNLALSVAQTGKRVLLIDADLHRPSAHKNFALEQGVGLTNVLIGEVAWKDTLRKLTFDGQELETFDLMTAGPSSPNPSELLNSKRMRKLLAEVRDEYDWVLIDTPPVLFVSDASIISVMCDGVILVVKSGDATRSLLARTMERLDAVRAHMVGSILNNVQVSRVGRYYSSYYNVGYSRYSRDYQRTYYAREGADEVSASPAAGPAEMGAKPAAADALLSGENARELAEARRTSTELKQKLDAETAKTTHLEQEIEKQQAEFKDQLARAAEAAPDPVDPEAEKAVAERDALKAELAQANEALSASKQALDDEKESAKAHLEELNSSCGDDAGEADELNELIAGLQTQISTARGALKAEQSKTKTFETHVAGIEKQHEERQKRLADTLSEKETVLQKAKAEADEQRRELASRDSAFQAEKQQLDKAIKGLKNDLKQEQQKNWLETSSEIDTLEKKLETSEQQVTDLRNDIKSGEKKLKSLHDTAAAQKKDADEKLTAQAAKLIAAAQETQTLAGKITALEAAAAKTSQADPNADAKLSKASERAKALEKDVKALKKQLKDETERHKTAEQELLAERDALTAEAQAAEAARTAPIMASNDGTPDESLRNKRAFRNAMQQTELHLSAGNNGEAAALAEKLVAVQPENGEAWEMAVTAHSNAKNLAGLQQNIRDLADQPELSHVYALAYGQLAVLQDDLPAARQYLEQGAEQVRKNPFILEALTRLDFKQGNTNAAEDHLKQFVKHFPRHPYGHYGTGTLQVLAGNIKKAEEALRKSVRMRKNAEALNDLAWLLSERGEHAIAEQMAREALSMNEDLPQVWDTLGTIQMNAKNFDDAHASFDRALSQAPQDVSILLNLAELQARTGDKAGIQSTCERLAPIKSRMVTSEHQRLQGIQGIIAKA